MELWIAGRALGKSEKEGHIAWEVRGVFDDQALAEDACTTMLDFVGPLVLNQRCPEETVEWPGCYYPKGVT